MRVCSACRIPKGETDFQRGCGQCRSCRTKARRDCRARARGAAPPEAPGRKDVDNALRVAFWKRVSRAGDNDCWTWLGCVDSKGYGRLRHGKRNAVQNMRANRVSWMVHHGAVPDDLVVMHLCDNPICVNPRHLALGTTAANNWDAIHKGRFRAPNSLKTHCLRGHALAGDNLSIAKDGGRICLTCRREKYAEAQARKRQAEVA